MQKTFLLALNRFFSCTLLSFFSYVKLKMSAHKNNKLLILWPFHMNLYKGDDDNDVHILLTISFS